MGWGLFERGGLFFCVCVFLSPLCFRTVGEHVPTLPVASLAFVAVALIVFFFSLTHSFYSWWESRVANRRVCLLLPLPLIKPLSLSLSLSPPALSALWLPD